MGMPNDSMKDYATERTEQPKETVKPENENTKEDK